MENKSYYAAIANLRVIAIVAIMLNHAQFGIDSDTTYSLAYIVYGQFFKFGSLLFMIISGFLFEKSIHKYSTQQLINKKTTTILLPAFLFMLPWLILNIGILPFIGNDKTEVTWQFAGDQIYNLFFRSIYWFPINLFLILIVNSFIRDANKLKWLIFPAMLITIFYSINIYYHWVPRRHNSAILAFFSIFMGGRLIHVYYDQIKALITRFTQNPVARVIFAVLMITFFSLSVYESYQIQKNIHGTDPNNILRFSNIVYTVLLLAFLYTIRHKINSGKYFQDKSVFLIYLIHPYFLFIGKQVALKTNSFSKLHTASNIPLEFFYAMIVLTLSLLIARTLLLNNKFNALLSGKKLKVLK